MLNYLIIRKINLSSYKKVLLAMQNFTNNRNDSIIDEFWFVQHPPVFTQGYTSRNKNILQLGNIPVIKSDRGGDITFHAPGQQIIYILINLRRCKLKVRDLIILLEKIVINVLLNFSISSHTCTNAPGVYVCSKKICSLGLHVKNGYTYHGLALNIKMDMLPFSYINPCGYVGLHMTQISDLYPGINIDKVSSMLLLECLNIFKVQVYKKINILDIDNI